MNLESRFVIKFLRFKRIKLLLIHHKLTLAFGEEAYPLASIKHWIHESNTGETILTNEIRSGRRSIGHIDVLIPRKHEQILFAPVGSLSDDAWRRFANSLL
jgi:hypothetical protein